jgi:hypothetical protein
VAISRHVERSAKQPGPMAFSRNLPGTSGLRAFLENLNFIVDCKEKPAYNPVYWARRKSCPFLSQVQEFVKE